MDVSEVKARVMSLLKVKVYNDHIRNYQKELAKYLKSHEITVCKYAAIHK